MAKKVLGLDLGTTSIGWAYITEAEHAGETSSIVRMGVRVNPLTTDEQTNFEKGKPVSENAERTLKRGMRRNLQRYQQRRDNLIAILRSSGLITDNTPLFEEGKDSTHSTYALRARASGEQITLEEFARVLLMINKKRGYKSSRKVKSEEEGQVIDGMAVARRLYEEELTPGQLAYQLLQEGRKHLPDFYRSDLQAELDQVWKVQQKAYPDIFTSDFKRDLEGKGQRATAASFWGRYGFNTAENKGTREEKRLRAYEWRSRAATAVLEKEEAAYVIAEINHNIYNSSGYLGAISDRSKKLIFNRQTVGAYLWQQLRDNPHTRLKNQVFYRQDYLDEFEKIWDTQAAFYPQLTTALKAEIRDVVIFYQRKLRSQKSLVSYCEFERSEREIERNGKTSKKEVGLKVCPKSSPLFQEFKIWQMLGNLKVKDKSSREVMELDLESRQGLFEELNVKGNLSQAVILPLLGYSTRTHELNYDTLEGNRTNEALFQAWFTMMEMEGHEEQPWKSWPVTAIRETIDKFFESQQIDPAILEFDAQKEGKTFEQQPAYQLWHLLYASDADDSPSGNDTLCGVLERKFGFKKEFANLLANLTLQSDYGSLSAKAIRKIFPFIQHNHYAEACRLAGYNHSAFLTREELAVKQLKDKLDLLARNSLRNPVVEKILNQLVNVVNAILADPEMGPPDEIRIELARELKKNAKERAEMTASLAQVRVAHEQIAGILVKEFGLKNPTRKDIIRYKLYEELRLNGYRTLYSNTHVPRELLFTKAFDVDHIIPQMSVFDDSFSNKTLCPRKENQDKGNQTAVEFIEAYYGPAKLEEYQQRVEMLFAAKEGGLSRAKYKKLLMRTEDIGDGFIERDLRNSQYIARKARQMLESICRVVVPTTGSITDRLRQDWGLINVMQELNFEKYKRLGLVEQVQKRDGSYKEQIRDWSKRDDHRHHAMDALVVAFTKHNHIQYLNYLNARKNELHPKHANVLAIQEKETETVLDDLGKKVRQFHSPLADFRKQAKIHLEGILVSNKSKTKVATKNINRYKTAGGERRADSLVPRGQLHKETVYGKRLVPMSREEKVGSKTDAGIIQQVYNQAYRKALQERLAAFGGDPKKAFTGKNSLAKNPLYGNPEKAILVPEKVILRWFEPEYTIRKDITPELKVDKVVDIGVRRILEQRLELFSGDPKQAFSDLDKNPIWLNQDKGIAIKRVTITGVKNVEALHVKHDHRGEVMSDEAGNPIPVDFVSTGNNHHVAIYRDAAGNLQDKVVSFFEAVERVRQGLPVIDRAFNEHAGWQFLFSMKQNEYFVFPADGFDPAETDLMNTANNPLISRNLYRVQALSILQYGNSTIREFKFRHHLETSAADKKPLKDIAYKQIKSLEPLEKIIKVRINHIGQIVKVGE